MTASRPTPAQPAVQRGTYRWKQNDESGYIHLIRPDGSIAATLTEPEDIVPARDLDDVLVELRQLDADLAAAHRDQEAVWKHLRPSESNDMPWSDEIIIAHENAVLAAKAESEELVGELKAELAAEKERRELAEANCKAHETSNRNIALEYFMELGLDNINPDAIDPWMAILTGIQSLKAKRDTAAARVAELERALLAKEMIKQVVVEEEVRKTATATAQRDLLAKLLARVKAACVANGYWHLECTAEVDAALIELTKPEAVKVGGMSDEDYWPGLHGEAAERAAMTLRNVALFARVAELERALAAMKERAEKAEKSEAEQRAVADEYEPACRALRSETARAESTLTLLEQSMRFLRKLNKCTHPGIASQVISGHMDDDDKYALEGLIAQLQKMLSD